MPIVPSFGVLLGRLNPRLWLDASTLADELGYESVWVAEHLVLPVDMGADAPNHAPLPPSTPVFDAAAYLSFLAGRTERIKLGTAVYLPALRHPFVTARAFATLDVVSNGRSILGIGAGWMAAECEAAGIDPSSRGRRLDEAVDVCRRLWAEHEVKHSGEFWSFPPVMFEPKPVQPLGPPVLIGGETSAALRRVVRIGDGWLGLEHSIDSASAIVRRIGELCEEAGRTDRPSITVLGDVTDQSPPEAWGEAGVDRILVSPWTRSSGALDGLRAFAERHCPTQ